MSPRSLAHGLLASMRRDLAEKAIQGTARFGPCARFTIATVLSAPSSAPGRPSRTLRAPALAAEKDARRPSRRAKRDRQLVFVHVLPLPGRAGRRRLSSVVGRVYRRDLPRRTGAAFRAFFQFNIVLGIVIAYLTNYWIVEFPGWQWMLGIEARPAPAFGLLAAVPESPRWPYPQP